MSWTALVCMAFRLARDHSRLRGAGSKKDGAGSMGFLGVPRKSRVTPLLPVGVSLDLAGGCGRVVACCCIGRGPPPGVLLAVDGIHGGLSAGWVYPVRGALLAGWRGDREERGPPGKAGSAAGGILIMNCWTVRPVIVGPFLVLPGALDEVVLPVVVVRWNVPSGMKLPFSFLPSSSRGHHIIRGCCLSPPGCISRRSPRFLIPAVPPAVLLGSPAGVWWWLDIPS
jgi:hypothetical protein